MNLFMVFLDNCKTVKNLMDVENTIDMLKVVIMTFSLEFHGLAFLGLGESWRFHCAPAVFWSLDHSSVDPITVTDYQRLKNALILSVQL